jgi:3-methyladenine DNA glycosylase/8-oxoguanine DNA glycosylase
MSVPWVTLSGMDSEAVRVWRAGRPVPLGAQLSTFRRGAGDPTHAVDPDGGWWRASRTPDGPAAMHLRAMGDSIEARAWGSGAGWLLESLPDLLGGNDQDCGFQPAHPALVEARKRFRHWRVPRSRLVLDALVPAVIEQKVTGKEAFAGYRTLVRRFGEPAPGPRPGLFVPPAPHTWAAIPSWEWLRAGLEPGRAATVRGAALRAGRLEALGNQPSEQARAALRTLPGIGVWTSAEVAQRAFGDADAISVGDYHVARNIGWALVGQVLDDEQMLEVLEPYVGHRYRVQRLLELAGHAAPRRGARRTLPTHLPR